jgi:hypothetical protein
MNKLALGANRIAVGHLDAAAQDKTTLAERQAHGTLALAAAVLMLAHVLDERLGPHEHSGHAPN